ncbi:MAG: AMP-binding protein, partial [Sneathiella sp.]
MANSTDMKMNQANATSEGPTSDSPLMSPINNLSFVRGPKTPPLIEKTIAAVFAETVATYGPLEAAYFAETGTRLTYTELGRLVDELAAGLLALGLNKGDRIGIWSPNRLEWVLMQFATARIGLILVNINPAYRLSELEYALNKVSCKALVTAATFKSSDYLEMIRTLAPEIENCAAGDLRSAALPDLKIVVRMGDEQSPGMLNFDDVVTKGRATLSSAALDEITNSLSADDPINIQFTSGTTGSPKGATLTHKNIINNG